MLGHNVQITHVLELIVKALLNNFVSEQCLYGINDSFLPIAVITFPKYDKEEFIATASVNVYPVDLDLFTRSLPAKSIIYNVLTLVLRLELNPYYFNVNYKTVCARELD